MRQMRRILALMLALLMTAALFGACQSAQTPGAPAPEGQSPQDGVTPDARPTVRVAALKGPTGMGMAYLMEQNEKGETAADYGFTLAGAPDEITSKLLSGELDIAAVPTNLAASLYNKTEGGVQLIANNTLGVLYLLSADEGVKTIADLRGKTLYASGQTSTAEYVLNYILEKNGLTPGEDVTVEYMSEHSELAAAAIAGKADVLMLPEPFVTNVGLMTDRFTVKLDLSEEWERVTDGAALVMGGLVVRRAFLDENKDAVDAFLAEYKASTDYTNEHPAEASLLIEKYGIMTAAVAEKAIPNCNIVYKDGPQMREAAEQFLSVLFESAPKSIGAKMPDADFYYQK